jgi:hypothetical protein
MSKRTSVIGRRRAGDGAPFLQSKYLSKSFGVQKLLVIVKNNLKV